jgi:serine/threonine protein kinase
VKSVAVPAEDKNHFAPIRQLTVSGVALQIGHQIARGAFSSVHQARDEWGHKLVAKVYQPNIKPEIWRNEAVMLRRFASSWVVPLHCAFEHGGRGYVVMEHAGLALGRCKFDGSAQQLVLHVAKWLLAGLHFLHRAGYVHNDINPQNVLLQVLPGNRLGAVRLIDLAFVCTTQALATSKKPMALWIPPPEYHDPSLGPRGPASDMYHAALLLMQLTTSTPLSYEESDCLQDRPVQDAVRSEHSLVRALAPALSVRPADRPSAIELWRGLTAVSVGHTVP